MESIMPDTDNFFKYLLTIGMVLILFAIIYPLKKEQELKVEAIEIQKKSEQLASQITQLKSQSADLGIYKDAAKKQIDELDAVAQKGDAKNALEIQKQKLDIKQKFEEKKAKVLSYSYDLDQKNIALKFEHDKHEEIQRQIWEYAAFKAIFWVIGIIFALFGFIFWMGSTYIDELLKGGHSMKGYESHYVKCLNFLKKKWFLATILITVLLSLAIFLYKLFAT